MSATNRGSQREPNDLYETHPWLIDSVLSHIDNEIITIEWINRQNPIKILEPAAGVQQNIVKSVQNYNWPVPVELDYGDLITGQDFLTHNYGKKYDLIITNPPFSLAMEFILRGLECLNDNGFLCYLLRVNFLGSKGRAKFLRENTPRIHVTPKRPCFKKNKNGKLGSDACEYAWFMWSKDRSHIFDPQIIILETEEL